MNTQLIKNLTVHCIIKNEEYWIWYCLKSIIPFCKRIMVWDTGSTDNTLRILQHPELYDCIELRRLQSVDEYSHTAMRNLMIEETKTEWFCIIDGDEIWTSDLFMEIAKSMNNSAFNILIVPFSYVFPSIGYEPNYEDEFEIANVKGAYAARVFRKKGKPKWYNSYFTTELRYADGTLATSGHVPEMHVLINKVLHFTLLPRSRKDHETMGRIGKLQFSGEPNSNSYRRIPDYTRLPDILVKKRPSLVKDPFSIRHEAFSSKVTPLIPLDQVKHEKDHN